MTTNEIIHKFLIDIELNGTNDGAIWEYADDIKKLMIEFAKHHVEQALKAVSKNAYVEYIDLTSNEIFDYTDVITDDDVGANVNKQSILNAYPLDNIK